jgi:NADPH2:quinone reductase
MGKVDEDVAAEKKDGFDDKQIWGWASNIPEFGRMFWKEFPKLVESGKLRPLRYSVIEGLDVEKVNAALDDIGASKGVRWHVRM